VDRAVTGIDPIDLAAGEAIERARGGLDGPLEPVVEPDVEQHGPERRDDHIAREQRALAVEGRTETAVIGLVARRVDRFERSIADLDRLAALDPAIDGRRGQELAVASERVDRPLDGVVVVLAREPGPRRVFAHPRFEVRRVAREALADARRGVHRGVAGVEQRGNAADVIDVGVGEHEVIDVVEVVAVVGEPVDELSPAALAGHARIDEDRLRARDQVGGDVTGRPVDGALDAAHAGRRSTRGRSIAPGSAAGRPLALGLARVHRSRMCALGE
jgi:hypothetical protein